MEMRLLGTTGLSVSVLGFGALEIGRDWAADVNPEPGHLTETQAADVLNGVLDRGINFIDTAPAYWYSEEYIGKGLAQRRDEYVLATKVGEHCDREGSYYDYCGTATMDFIERSLKRLQADHIDLLQIHSASIEVLEQGETLEAMQAAVRAGKVRFCGMTGNVAAAIRAIELGGFHTVQVPFNLLDTSAAVELFPLAQQMGVGVIIMRSLAGGKLTQKYVNLEDDNLKARIAELAQTATRLYTDCADPLARLALRFVAYQAAVSTIIVGTRRLEAVDTNMEHLVEPFSDLETAVFAGILSQETSG